ncbi:MAG TPA: DNA adenine methylase [Bacteroidia bacterium]|nr:DNA adenine methylase [Bacteroidia bacterium]
MKPPLTYFGGKQKLSQLILSLIPKHNLYCEPFFGGGAVFFAKHPSAIEVINDSNGGLINFYRVVKNNFGKLKKEILPTLHSRDYHMAAKMVLGYPHLFNEIKRAWAIWVLANEGYASRLDSSWGYDRKRNTSAKRLHYKREGFSKEYAQRLEKVEIENTDALKVIKTRDCKESFFYCDPPYFNAGMGHYKNYSEQDFENLLKLLSQIKGKFLLSSYPSELLNKYIRKNKWQTKQIEMPLSVIAKYKTGKRKTEVLTANYEM